MMLAMPGSKDLDRDFPAVRKLREVNLRNGCARLRLTIEAHEHVVDGTPVYALQDCKRLFDRERLDGVLQQRQLVGNIRRQQIAACGEHLPELDEDRAQGFQCAAQTHSTRRGMAPPQQRQIEYSARGARSLVLESELV